MRRRLAVTVRCGFSAAVLAALAFGTTQALAAPPAPAEVGLCKDSVCASFCRTIGFGTGWCVDGECFCYID